MEPVILFRRGIGGDDKNELWSAKKYFRLIEQRAEIAYEDTSLLVVGRYSVLPFYKELENDIQIMVGKLINTHKQHEYVADVREYARDLAAFTPRTYHRLVDLPEKGPFVLKGKTNSKKFLWNSCMFAQDKAAAIEVYMRLTNDGFIGDQDIVIRDFVPLKTYFTGMNGLPITKEFRFFVCRGQIISGGFYWSSHVDEIEALGESTSPGQVPMEFLEKVIGLIGDKVDFYALDVAQTSSGEWIVIELNDGQMSGLSCNKPEILYQGLHDVLVP